ncbi:unnamed protein product [Angiostrongylus costaricensis]|uniref:EGF-like domain-containing protein n=1 Tax=Angiostrongylus costaricensis TaxID=334426 RepID=A0A0R3PW69_ANGCS|nr:unnamed protein product [Angiostrongylus costaricensis]
MLSGPRFCSKNRLLDIKEQLPSNFKHFKVLSLTNHKENLKISLNSSCPPGYWGRRCELHFVARLFAPVKGQVEVEKSPIFLNALTFSFLSIIILRYNIRWCGISGYLVPLCHAECRIVRRNAPFDSTTVLSLNHHLRRQTMSFQTLPAAVNTTPSSSAAYLNRYSASQYFNCRTPFSPLSRRYVWRKSGSKFIRC